VGKIRKKFHSQVMNEKTVNFLCKIKSVNNKSNRNNKPPYPFTASRLKNPFKNASSQQDSTAKTLKTIALKPPNPLIK